MSAPAPIDILCLGEPLFEFAEMPDGQWQAGIGGDVSNVAIAARRQGAVTAMLTRLGDDSFGDAIMASWAQEGVRTEAVLRIPDAPTGLYFIRQTPEGHAFEYRRVGSAASLMNSADLPRDALSTCRLLHVSGISQAISDSAALAVRKAMTMTRAAGGTVAYDTNLRLKLWPMERARAVIHDAVSAADIALPGLDDARALTGLDAPEDIARFYLDLGPHTVALTLGAEGALIATRESITWIPPRPARAVDASGAGDCFDGAFLAEWLRCGDPVAAGRYAVTAASLSVEGIGAVAPIPHASQVRAALDAG